MKVLKLISLYANITLIVTSVVLLICAFGFNIGITTSTAGAFLVAAGIQKQQVAFFWQDRAQEALFHYVENRSKENKVTYKNLDINAWEHQVSTFFALPLGTIFWAIG